MRPSAQLQVLVGQPGELGDAQSGLQGHEEEGLVPSSGPGGLVGAGEQGIGLRLGEEGDDGSVAALGGDGQDPGDDRRVLGVAQAAKRKNDRMAARRALRVRALLCRSISRCSKKAPIKGASRSATSSSEGCLALRPAAKPSSSRQPSR